MTRQVDVVIACAVVAIATVVVGGCGLGTAELHEQAAATASRHTTRPDSRSRINDDGAPVRDPLAGPTGPPQTRTIVPRPTQMIYITAVPSSASYVDAAEGLLPLPIKNTPNLAHTAVVVLELTEPPGTPTPTVWPAWTLASATRDEIAEETLRRLVARGYASPDTRVIHVSDLVAGEISGYQPTGSGSDVVVTLDGEITMWIGGPPYGPENKPARYAVVTVERLLGAPYAVGLYDDLDEIPENSR